MVRMPVPTCVAGQRLGMVPAIDDVILNCLSAFQIFIIPMLHGE